MTLDYSNLPNPFNDITAYASSPFSNLTKSLYNTIQSNVAFKNPLTKLDSSNISLTDGKTYLESIESTPPSPYLTTDITSFITKTNSLITSHTNFTNHTNVLSGVTLFPSDYQHNIHSIMSIGMSHVQLSNALDQALDNPCGSLLVGFGSLFLGDEILSQIEDFYGQIQDILQEGDLLPEEIEGLIDNLKSQLDNSVLNDQNNLNAMIDDIKKAAIASILPGIYEHPCGRYLLKRIGDKDVRNTLSSEYGV